MSLGVGQMIGVGEDKTSLEASRIMFGGNDNLSTANRFITPNARGGGSSSLNASIKAAAKGKIKKFAIFPDSKSVTSRDAVISINNVDIEASRITMNSSTYQSVSLDIDVAEGDQIAIHFPAGGSSTDDYMYAVHIEYNEAPLPAQQITFSGEITVTTTFTRYPFDFIGSSVNYNGMVSVTPYAGKHLKCFVKVITAPTAGDSIQLVRRDGNAVNMSGTGTNIITDSVSDGEIVELEDDISFAEGDQLNIGAVRVGSAGVAPIIQIICVWEWSP